MKRFLALTLAFVGILPTAVIGVAVDAAGTEYSALEKSCRSELGYPAVGQLLGSQLFFVRRCVFNHQTAEEQSLEVDRIQQRYDQQFWRRHEIGQSFLHESRRSLRDRIDLQGKIREDAFRTLSLKDRSNILQQQRSLDRSAVREKERAIDQQWKAYLEERRTLNEKCSSYKREVRYKCLDGSL